MNRITISARVRRASDHISPFLFVLIHLLCFLVLLVPFSWELVALAAGSYLLRMWAITVGYHRYFSHRAFKTSRGFQFVLAFLGACSMQNGPLWWASTHRRHHRHSDTVDDPHSPLGGFFHSHVGWFFGRAPSKTNLDNVRDLTRYPELVLLERHRWLPLALYGLGCFLLAGWSGLLWGFVVSTVAVLHATMLINSLAHVLGSRPYATADRSRNNPLLAFLTLGEGWHNNHHFQMNSARQGFLWWEFDFTYYTLLFLKRLRLVWDVREPTFRARSERRVRKDKGTPSIVGPAAGPVSR